MICSGGGGGHGSGNDKGMEGEVSESCNKIFFLKWERKENTVSN